MNYLQPRIFTDEELIQYQEEESFLMNMVKQKNPGAGQALLDFWEAKRTAYQHRTQGRKPNL